MIIFPFPNGRAKINFPSNGLGAVKEMDEAAHRKETHQDDLVEQGPGRPVDDGVDRPEEGGPGLVVEDDHDAGVGQRRRVRLGLAPENIRKCYSFLILQLKT